MQKPNNFTDLTDEEWRGRLTDQQYKVLRQKATEAPFTGSFLDQHNDGVYACAGCGAVLFSSQHKFDSGSGWPSFYEVAKTGSIELHSDDTHGMQRVEATCATCGGHLGHVFDDAEDQPTGKRYCINSCALEFNPDKEGSSEE